jgi:hypothetical protein
MVRSRGSARWLACCTASIICVWLAAFPPVSQAQNLVSTSALSFGTFASTSGGRITIEPATGFRSATGSIWLVNQGPASSPARVTVTHVANASYSVLLPIDDAASLSNGGSAMSLRSFTAHPGLSGILGPSGSQTISIGATMVIGPLPAEGNYSGSLSVTILFK